MNTAVGKIIAANIVVFIIQGLFPAFTRIFALTPRLVVENFAIWQLFSYMFLHGGFMHLFFNMLMLWLFGSAIEAAWGSRQFMRYYIICGLGGALASTFFQYNNPVVGASGAIFGLYLAYAMMFPNNYIYVYFVFPVKAKYLVAGVAILQLLSGISGPSGIAYFAHLGGMAAGLLFFRGTIMQRARGTLGSKQRWQSHTRERVRPREDRETDNIDSILDKISAKGYENLSTTEKRILDNYSRKKRNENQ